MNAIDTGIVRNHGQVLHAGFLDGLHQVSATPHRPKPPAMMVMPSLRTPASAAVASEYTLPMKTFLFMH